MKRIGQSLISLLSCIMLFTCSMSEGEPGEFTEGPFGGEELPVEGAALWLRADRDVCKSTSNKVNAWEDQTPNGNTAIAMVKPEWVDNVLNEKPVIRFSGTEYFLLPEFMSSSNVTVFIVGSFPQQGTNQYIFSDKGADDNQLFYIRIQTGVDTITFRVQDSFPKVIEVKNTKDPSSYHITTARLSGTTSELLYNGSDKIIFDEPDYDPSNIWSDTKDGEYPTIGKNCDPDNDNYLTGDLAEIIIYRHALPDGDRVKIECYLGEKYGIAVAGCD